MTAAGQELVLLGMMTRIPVAGVVWQTVHYLLGLRAARLRAVLRRDARAHAVDADGARGRRRLGARRPPSSTRVMRRFGLGDRWAYHAPARRRPLSRHDERELKRLYASAELIINLHGGTEPLPEHYATGRLVYLETDPVQLQVELHAERAGDDRLPRAALRLLHLRRELGAPDCGLPVSDRFHVPPDPAAGRLRPLARPRRAPSGALHDGRQLASGLARRDVRRRALRWSKHHEFLQFLDLPRRTGQPFELALVELRATRTGAMLERARLARAARARHLDRRRRLPRLHRRRRAASSRSPRTRTCGCAAAGSATAARRTSPRAAGDRAGDRLRQRPADRRGAVRVLRRWTRSWRRSRRSTPTTQRHCRAAERDRPRVLRPRVVLPRLLERGRRRAPRGRGYPVQRRCDAAPWPRRALARRRVSRRPTRLDRDARTRCSRGRCPARRARTRGAATRARASSSSPSTTSPSTACAWRACWPTPSTRPSS